MLFKNIFLSVISALSLCSCAYMLSGTDETLSFESDPLGAQCQLTRDGKIIGNVTTPGKVKVTKTKDDIAVTCKKDGFQDATARLKSGFQDEGSGNAIVGGLVGYIIDSSTGADNHYDDHLKVTLSPLQKTTATSP